MRRKMVALTLAVLAVATALWWWQDGSDSWRTRSTPEQRQVFAAIEAQGGKVGVEELPGGRRQLSVSFFGPRVTDASLASLEGPGEWPALYIQETKVTGSGLASLSHHTQLE